MEQEQREVMILDGAELKKNSPDYVEMSDSQITYEYRNVWQPIHLEVSDSLQYTKHSALRSKLRIQKARHEPELFAMKFEIETFLNLWPIQKCSVSS